MGTATATATARRSIGEYKPLIRYPNGRTEVCEQSPERRDKGDVRAGGQRGNRMARGTTYASRHEAAEAAQKVIDLRLADARRRLFKARQSGRGVAYIQREIALWGGAKDE